MPIREKVLLKFELLHCSEFTCLFPGADPGFQVRGGALKIFFGVFRVKNHDLSAILRFDFFATSGLQSHFAHCCSHYSNVAEQHLLRLNRCV
jgi:hypothetical protein